MDATGSAPAPGAGGAGPRTAWLTFLLAGLAPALILSGNVLGATVPLAALFPALAAVFATATGIEPRPGDRPKRVLLAAGVIAVLGGATLARSGLGQPAYTAFAVGIPTALTAWVLSSAYSPSPAVRALVRPLTSTRGSRSAYLVAVFIWPGAAALSVAACSRIPDMSIAVDVSPGLDLLTGRVVPGVAGAALAAVAWYGFAARRLQPRLSPLTAGLLIGGTQWLITWSTAIGWSGLADPFFLTRLAGSAAAAIAAVWVLARSRGSLLPVWLLGALLPASTGVALLLVSVDAVARADTLEQVFSLVQVVLAAALVIAGRMWRRPADPLQVPPRLPWE
jgi:hypothetical protein